MNTTPFRKFHLLLASIIGAAPVFTDNVGCAALLEGKTMRVNLFHRTNESDVTLGGGTNIVVGPEVELPNFPETINPTIPIRLHVDVSDKQVLFTLVTDQPLAVLERVQVIDSEDTIPGTFDTRVSINPATNWAGFNESRLNPSGNTIQVAVSGLSGLAGQFILLDVVPEPATAGLMLSGLAAVTALGRRRRR